MTIRRTTLVKYAILGVALVVFAVLVFGPTWITVERQAVESQPSEESFVPPPYAPQRALAVFVLAVALWLTNVIPPPVTGLFVVALIPLLGITSASKAFSYFGNHAVFFILGVFLLAAAMIRTGLSGRLTLLFLQRFDKTPTMLVTGIVVSASFLALWMPEHAVAAMMFPIVLEIAQTLNLQKGKSALAKMMFLGLAWGSVVGGIGTFLGGARAPLALDLLHKHAPDASISFLSWMKASMPLVVILTGVVVFVLRWRLQPEIGDIKRATHMLDERVRRLGPLSNRERKLAVLGSVTIAAWVLGGHHVELAVTAVLSATLLFVLRIVNWREIEEFVNWGVILMYGGAIALGKTIDETGVLHKIATDLISSDTRPVVLFAIMAVAALALTEGISNAAAVAILLPIGFAICDTAGISPQTMTLVVTIPAGLAFMLPISSPPNAMCYSAGYYSVRESISVGIIVSTIALLVTLLCIRFYWPLVGYGFSSPS